MSMKDLKWNGNDVTLGQDSDLETRTGTPLLEQSLAILVRDEIDNIVGEVITPSLISEVEASITQAVSRDPQVTGIISLEVTEINKQTDTIKVKARTTEDDTFTINA